MVENGKENITSSTSYIRYRILIQIYYDQLLIIFYRPTDHKGPILSCNFSPSGRLGMTGGIDGKTLIWM